MQSEKEWVLNQKKKPNKYWQSWENFESELKRAIEANGGEFPSLIMLVKMRKGSLSAAFKYYGGAYTVRERMGYEVEKKPSGYWKKWENVESELKEVIDENGGEFPASIQLKKMGRRGILNSLKYHGGINAVRERMGYEVRIRTSDQFIDWLKKDETARNLMGVAAMLNGQSRDVEKIIADIFEGKIKDKTQIHAFLEEKREEVYQLIRDGLTNLGPYLGDFSLHERKIFPVLMGQVIASIPEEKVASLEDRLLRILKVDYSPRFNLQPEETLAELGEKIKSFGGRRKDVYQKLYEHYQEVLKLGEEI